MYTHIMLNVTALSKTNVTKQCLSACTSTLLWWADLLHLKHVF